MSSSPRIFQAACFYFAYFLGNFVLFFYLNGLYHLSTYHAHDYSLAMRMIWAGVDKIVSVVRFGAVVVF